MYHQFCGLFVRHPLTRSFLIVLMGLTLTMALARPAFAASGPNTGTHSKPFATRIPDQHAFAVAITCSGNQCNGRDPYQTGCANSFYAATSVEAYPLLVELEYSPLCRTNWTQAYWLDGSTPAGWGASIERFAGPNGPDWFQIYWSPIRQWWINTNQVYAPVNTSQACEIAAPVYPLTVCTNQNLG